jgi:hypothetical protein
MSFKNLKNSSNDFEKLNAELQKLQASPGSTDERFWKPEVDAAGNGYAVIRFLPAPEGEDVPFIRYYDHAFKGPSGAWYIENSLTTLGQQDPVSEYNSQLWNSGVEKNKETARKQKRNLRYVSNIYVVNDPAHPENNGKVFLFRYGKKIFDKLNDAMNPKFPGETPMNPFNLWTGANFKLKIAQVAGYRNYDSSVFGPVEPLSADDAVLEKIYMSEYPLQEFIAKDKFKTYDELKAKLHRVLSGDAMDQPLGDDGFSTPKPQKTAEAKQTPVADFNDSSSDDDFFKKLANEDSPF